MYQTDFIMTKNLKHWIANTYLLIKIHKMSRGHCQIHTIRAFLTDRDRCSRIMITMSIRWNTSNANSTRNISITFFVLFLVNTQSNSIRADAHWYQMRNRRFGRIRPLTASRTEKCAISQWHYRLQLQPTEKHIHFQCVSNQRINCKLLPFGSN